MNEIKITTTQRSIEKTCQDVDNKANWVVLHKNSVIHLEGTAQKARLHDYPYPFINHLALSPVNAEIVLPSSPDRETVEAMLKIASDWGYRLRGGNLQNLRVITGEADNGPNQVLVSVLKEKGGKEEGYLNLTSDAGLYRLHVSGSDAEGLKKAASFLASDFIKQAESDEMRIKEYMEKSPTKRYAGNQEYNFKRPGLWGNKLNRCFSPAYHGYRKKAAGVDSRSRFVCRTLF